MHWPWTGSPLLIVYYNYRDGMIKRPGNEKYLGKVIAEERKAYSEVLAIGSQAISPSESVSEVEEEEDESHSD